MAQALIVTPTYNELHNLEALVAGVFEVLPEVDILVVDDGSPDGTGELADEIAARDTRVEVMHRTGKLGLGTAYLAGFAWGLERGYEYIFEMDADLSHDPRCLPSFLEALEGGADLVIGSRNVPGGRRRRVGSVPQSPVQGRKSIQSCDPGARDSRSHEWLQSVPSNGPRIDPPR